MKKLLATVLAFALVLGCMGITALAATSSVSDIGSLQSAIDTAAAGDTIQIAQGSYTVSAVITVSKSITIEGLGTGATLTANGISILFLVTGGGDITFRNLDITAYNPVKIDSPTLLNSVTFEDMTGTAPGVGNDGEFAYLTGQTAITTLTFDNVTASDYFRGLFNHNVGLSSTATDASAYAGYITNLVIKDSFIDGSATTYGGGTKFGFYAERIKGSITITNSTLTTSANGSGIDAWITGGCDVTITGCDINTNKGGIRLESCSCYTAGDITITGNKFGGDTTRSIDLSLGAPAASVTIEDNSFSGDTGTAMLVYANSGVGGTVHLGPNYYGAGPAAVLPRISGVSTANFTYYSDEARTIELDALGNQVSGGSQVDADADPTYTVVIPSSVNFDTINRNMSAQSRDFTVSVTNALIEENATITVQNVTAEGDMVMKNKDGLGTKTLAFDLTLDSIPFTQAQLQDYAESVTTTVTCIPSDLKAAGSYRGFMTFSITYTVA